MCPVALDLGHLHPERFVPPPWRTCTQFASHRVCVDPSGHSSDSLPPQTPGLLSAPFYQPSARCPVTVPPDVLRRAGILPYGSSQPRRVAQDTVDTGCGLPEGAGRLMTAVCSPCLQCQLEDSVVSRPVTMSRVDDVLALG